MESFAVFGLAFLCRPIGGLILGYIGESFCLGCFGLCYVRLCYVLCYPAPTDVHLQNLKVALVQS